ncbi:hypothetical protein IW140_003320 [Coemansia sp. RSA 1813]|nr:hypothetical protein EV178_001816 [Coemansia sp. RSA 1646]KAJ1770571.1 hypothetical protein LPJ74_003098 [Coemansia sp. RSA 1843]KAJ2211193.1 hypothetical protein EV179_005693 [Coemansia sp. RSA 487]KAJ2569100.1 hypothetical protein IW140_003320 [Coemansia sp. RSA 1813]
MLLLIVLGSLVLLVLTTWYLLNKQSAKISSQGIALAAGAPAASLLSKRRGTTNNAILITGPTQSGKTSLWYYLRFPTSRNRQSNENDGDKTTKLVSSKPSLPETLASMAINTAESDIHEANALLIDIPGHPKFKFDRDSHLALAKGVLFVVDSSTISQSLRATAEVLYEVLANKHVQEKECPVLLLCNKQDEPSSLSNVRIKAMLEDEINNLRASRQASTRSLGHNDDDAAADDKAADFLGYDGKKFSFEDLPNPVQFNESSMLVGHDAGGLEHIERWIADTIHS